MTYIFIGAIFLIVLAILFTLRSDRKKDKLINDLRRAIQNKEELAEKNREFFTSKMSIQSQEIYGLTQERNYYREQVDEISKKFKSVSIHINELNRWVQLVEDCKKPFIKRKQPINVGGRSTRSMIIAIHNIVKLVIEISYPDHKLRDDL